MARCSLAIEDARREALDEVAADDVGALGQDVDRVDRLFGHGEPLLRSTRSLDGLLQLPEQRVLHVEPKRLVEKRAY